MAISTLHPAPVDRNAPAGADRRFHLDVRTMDFRAYYELVRKWAWLLILVPIVVGAGTYAYTSRYVSKSYEAKATLQVTVEQVGAGNATTPCITCSEEYAPTAAQLLHTIPVARLALTSLKGTPNLPKKLTSQGMLNISNVTAFPSSSLITVTVTSAHPILARNIANALAKAGKSRGQALQSSRYAKILSSLQGQVFTYQTQIAALRKLPNRGQQITADIQAINRLRAAQLNILTSEASSATTLEIPSPAATPKTPVSPRPLRTAIVAALLGFLFSFAVLVVREYFATTLRSPEEITDMLGSPPVLGAVIRLPSSGGKPGMTVADQPRGATAEAYRVMRTNILFASPDRRPRTILTTSAREGEGKTTTALNLGASLAELGGRVLMVDADLRRPSLHRALGLSSVNGLTQAILFPDQPWNDLVQATSIPNLYLMSSGPIPPNPAEMLSSERMRQVLAEMASAYDTVVVDSPPLLAVADPAVLSTFVDFVVFVVDVNLATVQGMSRAREALVRVGTGVSGVVLNKLGDDRRTGYYYYHYSQGYGYGYGPREENGAGKRSRDEKTLSRPDR